MARLRLDPTTWTWVITGEPAATPDARDSGGLCPFCPESEAYVPRATAERRAADGNWSVRAFHDRFPIFHAEGIEERRAEGMFDGMNAIGAHEIIVEGREHHRTLAQQGPELLEQVLDVYRDRIVDLKGDKRFRYVEIFKNQGRLAGGLLDHPHSQLLAAPVLPTRVEREMRAAKAHYEMKERCLYCDILRQELRQSARVVEESADYVTLCPFASRYAYETWILPKIHSSSFETTIEPAGQRAQLARIFWSALRKTESVSASLHFVLHTEPNLNVTRVMAEQWQSVRQDYHWHIELMPRLDRRQKYLREEEFFLNTLTPEEAARVLREA